MSAQDQFFDKGWCWMAHPDRNIGNPIPVFMYEADGTRFYVPLDPSEGGELCWDERDEQWEMVQSPGADPDANAAFDLYAARAAGGHLAALVGELRAEIAALKAGPQGATPLYLVQTGQVCEGAETYTRHEGKPPPMCDYEGPLHAAPAAPRLEPSAKPSVQRIMNLARQFRTALSDDYDDAYKALQNAVYSELAHLAVPPLQPRKAEAITNAALREMAAQYGCHPDNGVALVRAVLAVEPIPNTENTAQDHLAEGGNAAASDLMAVQFANDVLERIANNRFPAHESDTADYRSGTIKDAQRHAAVALKRLTPALCRMLAALGVDTSPADQPKGGA